MLIISYIYRNIEKKTQILVNTIIWASINLERR
jgi:hypothetical protein